MIIPETDLAWAAGIIDGEGSIGIVKQRNSFRLIFKLGMTHKETILRLRSMFKVGDVIYRALENPKHKDSYCWNASGDAVLFIVKHTIRFLITKKAQALLALEYGEKCFHKRGGTVRVPVDTEVMREVSAAEMAILNVKGKDAKYRICQNNR